MPTGPTGPASTASAEPTRGGSGVTSRPSSRELIARQASRTGNHAGPLHEAGGCRRPPCWACDACAGCPPRCHSLVVGGSQQCLVAVASNQLILTPPSQSFVERVVWHDDLAAGWHPHQDPRFPVVMA